MISENVIFLKDIIFHNKYKLKNNFNNIILGIISISRWKCLGSVVILSLVSGIINVITMLKRESKITWKRIKTKINKSDKKRILRTIKIRYKAKAVFLEEFKIFWLQEKTIIRKLLFFTNKF